MRETENSIARQLRGIKYVLILSLCVSLVYTILSTVYWYTIERREYPNLYSDFVLQAKSLSNDGKLDELLNLSLSREKERPNDISAYWYEGLARYEKRDWKGAVRVFNHYLDLAPNAESSVQPYITKAQQNLEKATGSPHSQ